MLKGTKKGHLSSLGLWQATEKNGNNRDPVGLWYVCFSCGNKNISRHGTDLVVLGGEGFKTGNAYSFNAVTEQVTFFIRVLFVKLEVLRTALLVPFRF
jgi:hypothetical protein